MARKRRYSSPSSTRRVIHNANRRLPRPDLLSRSFIVQSVGEDFRRFHPNANRRRLRTLGGAFVRARAVVGTEPFRSRVSGASRFLSPWSVRHVFPRDAVVCVRRKIRKEVIFATGKAGRGGQRRPRRNENSDVVCRR